MVKLPTLRRSGSEARTREREDPTQPQKPAEPPRYSTKVEQAAERAADETRNAAAAAAKRAHARPRTSGLASLALVLAVAAGLTVATGTLARLGIVVGAVALLVALAGLPATGRHRRRSGRTEVVVALVIAAGAIVVGALAAAGQLSWLDPDTSQVARLHDWLPSWLS